MADIVDLIIECFEKGMSNSTFNCLQGSSVKDVRVLMIQILSWLKLEHKREIWMAEGRPTKLKPLLLNNNDSWYEKLREMVEKEAVFNKYFCINGNQFDFSNNIAWEDRIKARKKAFDYYNPQKRT